MFKKFDAASSISSKNTAKASVVKGIKNSLLERYPEKASLIEDEIFGADHKKDGFTVIKCHDKIQLFQQGDRVILFQQYDDPILPSLRLLHEYPNLLPKVQVDQGAIIHLLAGANVMAPGFFGKKADPALKTGDLVGIYVVGKEHAIGIGRMLVDGQSISPTAKGHAIENLHYLGDPLWKL